MPNSYRVYTKRKLVKDPELEKGFVKKTRQQKEIDNDTRLKAKYILKSEYQQLDRILDLNESDKNGKKIIFAFKQFNHCYSGVLLY